MSERYTYSDGRVGLRALTLWQPWAGAVASGLKRVENRTWSPPSWLLGRDLAIHAGKRWDEDSDLSLSVISTFAERLYVNSLPAAEARGAVVAVARVVAVSTEKEAVERIAPGQGRWFFGPYGMILDDIRQLADPVPCRGYQALWTLPEDDEVEVRSQVGG